MNPLEETTGLQGRRDFCAFAGMAVALSAVGAGPLNAESPDKDKGKNQVVGPIKLTTDTRASLGKNALKDYRKQGGFFLIADAGGIFAMTSICTHAGCTVHPEDGKGFGCPCHDSEYDLSGAVTQGPAKSPLKHFEVSEPSSGGPLAVDLSKVVAANVRY